MFISFIYVFTTVSGMLNNFRNAIITDSHDFFYKKGCLSTDNCDYETKVRKAKPWLTFKMCTMYKNAFTDTHLCTHMHTHMRTHAHSHTPTHSLPFHDGFADGSGSGEAQFTDIRMFRESLTHHRSCSRQSIHHLLNPFLNPPTIYQTTYGWQFVIYTVWDITGFLIEIPDTAPLPAPTTLFWMMGMCNSLRIPSVNTTQHNIVGRLKACSTEIVGDRVH